MIRLHSLLTPLLLPFQDFASMGTLDSSKRFSGGGASQLMEALQSPLPSAKQGSQGRPDSAGPPGSEDDGRENADATVSSMAYRPNLVEGHPHTHIGTPIRPHTTPAGCRIGEREPAGVQWGTVEPPPMRAMKVMSL